MTRRVAGTADPACGQGKSATRLVTNDAGGILDDVLVYHLADSRGQQYYLLVVNASNRQKIVDWIEVQHDKRRATSPIVRSKRR